VRVIAILSIGNSCSDEGLPPSQFEEYSDGEAVFRHACKLGLEGIVSKLGLTPQQKDFCQRGLLTHLSQPAEV